VGGGGWSIATAKTLSARALRRRATLDRRPVRESQYDLARNGDDADEDQGMAASIVCGD